MSEQHVSEETVAFYEQAFDDAQKFANLNPGMCVGPLYIVDTNVKGEGAHGYEGGENRCFLLGSLSWVVLEARLKAENDGYEPVQVAQVGDVTIYRFRKKADA